MNAQMADLLAQLNQNPRIAAAIAEAGAHNHPALGPLAGLVAPPAAPATAHDPESEDDDTEARDQILLAVNHKKRKSKLLLLHGTTRGGMCYTRSAVPPMPMTEDTAEISLDVANKTAILMIEDHPTNSYRHELKLILVE